MPSASLPASASPAPPVRLERDSFGDIRVPAARLWGAQTQRSLQHFDISTECLPDELIHALVLVKRAARLGPCCLA